MTFIIDGLKGIWSLVTSILFLFEGISFGCIQCGGMVSLYNDKPRLFLIQFARGFAILSFLYYLIIGIISGIYGYYDVFIIIFSFLGLACSVATAAFIDQHNNGWSSSMFASGIPLGCKLCHTLYFTINEKMINDTSSGLYAFLLVSLIFEVIFLLCWTLWPYLTIKSVEQSIPLTVWSLEFTDILSHLIVCIIYASSIADSDKDWNNPYIATYFAFFVINLWIWCLPLYFLIAIISDGEEEPQLLGWHIILLDSLTDIPILITTLAGRTYLHNPYITIDIFVKIILLLRGIVWVPIVLCSDRFEPMLLGDWDYRLSDVKKVEEGSTQGVFKPKNEQARRHSF